MTLFVALIMDIIMNRENGIFHICILFKGMGFQCSMDQDESLSGIRVNSA
jgi:hypothetical protein